MAASGRPCNAGDFYESPIWFLIGRLSAIIGGTGWARSELIDQAIKHFSEWWLLGTTYTAHWAADNGLIVLPGISTNG